jgi:hypothetical protein
MAKPIETRADKLASLLQKRGNALSRIDALLADLASAVREETQLRRAAVEIVGEVGGSWPDKFIRERFETDTQTNALVLAHLAAAGIGKDRRHDRTQPLDKLTSLAALHAPILEAVQAKDLLHVD